MSGGENLRDKQNAAIFYDPSNGDLATHRTTGKGTYTPTGLKNGGQDTILTAVDSTWTKVERSATTNPIGSGILANRNSLKISNYSAVDVYTTINPDPNGTGQTIAVGDRIYPANSQFLDIAEKDNNGNPINLWVRSASGNATVFFREIG